MKLLLCEDCGDIVAPKRTNRDPRFCECRRHAVWWEDGRKGILRVWDVLEGPLRSKVSELWYPVRPRAYVIGLSNTLLQYPDEKISADTIAGLIDLHADSYLFKKIRSLVIRIRPGESSDTAWSRLPG